MSFGKDLSNEFYKLTRNVKFDEVDLFTKLQDAFINLKSMNSYQYAIDIIHGAKSYVDFNFNSHWVSNILFGASKTRELADVLFVIYSPCRDIIRITYMQNKKGDAADKFKADLCQLHLLAKRERIISTKLPACVFGDPDILSKAILPSVGSYGVFYRAGSDIEMSYFPAANITPCRAKANSVIRKVKYDYAKYKFGDISQTKGFDENQGTYLLEEFGDSLIRMEIGTPIKCGASAYTSLLKFLFPHLDSSESLYEWIRKNDYVSPFNKEDPFVFELPFTVAINADMTE